MVVAVLDTGLDYSHEAFAAMPEHPAWDKNYVATKIAEAGDGFYAKVTADKAYYNAKIPYAYDYADDDADVYPSDTGTTVSVENLFFNTPARAKFLKASKSEETDITNIITRLILSHPDIAFKYTSDGKVMLQSFGGGLDEAIIEIYGYNTITDCIPIETEKNGIKISGFIGKNYFTKPNRTYQTVILNGRYVVNNTIQSSMHNAYAAYLMKRQYPFYVLKIDMSPETVDVNVHPNKTDVRFIDNQVIYSTLYSVVTKVLDGSAAALEIVKPNNYVPIDEGSRPIIPQKPITPDEIGEAHCDRPFVSGFNEELLDQGQI